MQVFILSTGRCGSTTFAKACEHITNFTTAHESRGGYIGEDRFAFPENHIESDNRLSWFLGRLDRIHGDRAIYVHLRRDDRKTAESFAERYNRGILRAYRCKMLMRLPSSTNPLDVCLDYCDTVNSNIALFLRDKTKKMDFRMENGHEDFITFWKLIGAEGDLQAALAEWDVAYNPRKKKSGLARFFGGLGVRIGCMLTVCGILRDIVGGSGC
ncbi:MAG: hypothetical protein WC205_03620 [Opitutaceae bacterium]|jgi:hypothetical protein